MPDTVPTEQTEQLVNCKEMQGLRNISTIFKPAEDAIRLTAEKAHRRLHDIAMGKLGPGYTGADEIRAISEYNKMVGGYEPEKLEVSPFGAMLARVRKKRR